MYTNYYYSAGMLGLPPSISGWPTHDWMQYVDNLDLEYYVQKAAAAIYSSGWDALTFITEIGQLRRMLSGVAKKFDKLSTGRRPDELYNLWLEGRYGWRTLMYDIRDLHEVLTRVKDRRSRYRETKGHQSSGMQSDSGNDNNANIIGGYASSISWVLNQRGTVVADIDVPDLQFNPVTTAWEVTRLSFVVDWLLNVGQALEAASFLLAARSYASCGGFRVDLTVNTSTYFVANAGSNNNGFLTGSCSGTVTCLGRVPMAVSALPRQKLRLDAFKVIDLLALVAQRIRR